MRSNIQFNREQNDVKEKRIIIRWLISSRTTPLISLRQIPRQKMNIEETFHKDSSKESQWYGHEGFSLEQTHILNYWMIDLSANCRRKRLILFNLHCVERLMIVCRILSRAFMRLWRRNNNDNQCDNIHFLQACKASSRCRRPEVQLLSIGREMNCFFFRKPSGRSISTLLHRKWNIKKNYVEQLCSIIDESPRRVHLSYSRSIGSLGHFDVGLECVHTTRSHHWDISSLSGKVHN